MAGTRPVTEWLSSWSEGQDAAAEVLMDAVYEELHRMAERALHGERDQHTLQPTALVHEAFLRFEEQRHVDWQSRNHFFAIAAKMMRRVLVDYGRRRQRKKRGSGVPPVPVHLALETIDGRSPDLVDLDLALDRLATVDPIKVSIVELHFFSGFSVAETAEILEISTATVSRQWRAAKAWLFQQLETCDQCELKA